jgi:hypothetical protein
MKWKPKAFFIRGCRKKIRNDITLCKCSVRPGCHSGLTNAETLHGPISKVSDQVQNRVFTRPLAHKAKLDLVKNRLTSFQSQ